MYPSIPRVLQLITDAEVEGHYKHQLAVVNSLKKHLKKRLDKVSSSLEDPEAISVAKLDFEEAADLIENIENRTAEINDLQSTAAPLNEQVCVSISPKLVSSICL
jgi:excinuclease UvrABC nuclease subunit